MPIVWFLCIHHLYFLIKNLHTAKCLTEKCSLSKMFIRQKVPRRSIITAKCSHDEMSLLRSVLTVKILTGKCPMAKCTKAENPINEINRPLGKSFRIPLQRSQEREAVGIFFFHAANWRPIYFTRRLHVAKLSLYRLLGSHRKFKILKIFTQIPCQQHKK